ncbi:MAG: YgjV family protein [Clostridia bacterium]|nr:YgjV family protein [Clostridia bacterium]
MACKLCADVCWAAHYFLLGAYGGMIPNAVGVFRELVFMQRDKKSWAGKPLIPVIFILINWCVGISTFISPVNIMPIAASTFVTVSLWLRRPKLTKIISAPVSVTFLIYDLIVGSWIGAVNETAALISIAAYFIKDAGERKHGGENDGH